MKLINSVFYFGILIIFIMMSCNRSEPEKPDIPDPVKTKKTIKDLGTVIPSDYFPAYPGSYWVYDIADLDGSNGHKWYKKDTARVMDEYQTFTYFERVENLPPNIDSCEAIWTAKLPYIKGFHSEYYLKGYHMVFPLESNCSFSKLLLSEKTDIIYNSYSNRFQSISHRTITTDTTITFPNGKTYTNVLIVATTDDGNYRQGYFYAKNIGLIARESFDDEGPNGGPLMYFVLSDYYINK